MSVMGAIGLLFAGKPERHPDTGWEPFREYDPNRPEPEPEPEFDATLAQEWAQVIGVAKKNGFTVKYTEEGLYMERGKSNGTFKDPRGGLEMAKKFLRHHI